MAVVLSHVEDHVGKLTLNRPEAANAFSLEMLRELMNHLQEWKNERDIRVLLLTGAGEKVFSAGADLKERANMNEDEVREAVGLIRKVVQSVHEFPKPVICAINGAAIGGGLELALACDLRIASENASFALSETGLGIIPGAGGTQRLPRLIGVHKAKEMIYTGRRLTATEALQEGLLLKVTYRKELQDVGMDLAYDVSQRAPLANSLAKQAINQGIETDLEHGMEIEAEAYEKIIPTKDRLEGLAAFKEKRSPKFTGE
ncbi:enoyl-CoA hydratase [Salipaludibacillus keqinensis]|uniref:Enoyl-CoA hydratase n=1 Tax=Salipaludibacillus keqinensis TaxID=2045207 RepID=A0A323TIQ2_9BACI|nr:enoyl-CoA hydratase [Salipaludibacillus keqinensis]PYZ94086.1 enoyl-CoA hydratase [Salipaludibacillus keqinensis]